MPRLALLDGRTETVSVLVVASARISRKWRIGAGVLALAALIGNIAITPDAAGHITTVSEEQLVTDYAPVVGLRYDPLRWLSLGLVLRGESKSEYDLKVTNSLGARLPISLPTLRIAGVAQYDPLQIQVEGAFRHRWLLLNLGVVWKHCSAFPRPVDTATPGALAHPPSRYHYTPVPRVGAEASGAWG